MTNLITSLLSRSNIYRLLIAITGVGLLWLVFRSNEEEVLETGVRPRLGNRLNRGMIWLFRQTIRFKPVHVLLVSVAIGALLNVAAFFIKAHLFTFVYSGTEPSLHKEVGFWAAPNWGLAALIVLPLILMYMTHALRSLDVLFDKLYQRRMMVTPNLHVPTPNEVRLALDRRLARGLWAAAVVLLLIIPAVMAEFTTVAGHFLSTGEEYPAVTDMQNEFYESDWSVSALLPTVDGGEVDADANYWFTMTAYLAVAGVGTGSIFAFFVLLFMVSIFFVPSRKRKLLLIPDVFSEDRRRGFEIFEPLMKNVLIITALSFVLLYLINVQNYYLRSETAEDIVKFMLPSLEKGLASFQLDNIMGSIREMTGVIFSDSGKMNWQTYVTTPGPFLAFTLVVGTFGVALSLAAKRGGKKLLAKLAPRTTSNTSTVAGVRKKSVMGLRSKNSRNRLSRKLSPAEITERLKDMDPLPVGWMRPWVMILITVVCALSFTYHKLGLYAAGLALGGSQLPVLLGTLQFARKYIPGRDPAKEWDEATPSGPHSVSPKGSAPTGPDRPLPRQAQSPRARRARHGGQGLRARRPA